MSDNNIEYIKKLVEKYKECYEETDSPIIEVMERILDFNRKEEFINSEFLELFNLANSEEDPIAMLTLKKIILSIDDKDYMMKFFRNFEDETFVKSIIKDILKNPNSQWNSAEKTEILFEFFYEIEEIVDVYLESKYYISKCDIIEFLEKQKNKIESDILKAFTLLTQDEKYIKQKYEEGIFGETVDLNSMAYIELPSDMTLGMEIEVEGKFSCVLEECVCKSIKGWVCDFEGSLNKGIEVKSPKLRSNRRDEEQIYKVCNLLANCGLKGTEQCGGHIHIGADYLKSVQSWRNLAELYGNTEEIFYIICNGVGKIPRKSVLKWAEPISKGLEHIVTVDGLDLENENDINKFVKELSQAQFINGKQTKYTSINFLNIGKSDKNTVEFRAANQPDTPEEWIQNLNLCGGYVKGAQELAYIQEKPLELRTKEEQRKLENFEKIKMDIDEEEKLESLLEIIIPENRREIYRERYRINTDLVNTEFITDLYERTNEFPIVINKKSIAKTAFEGKNGIDANEYGNSQSSIEHDLEEREH